jgi:cytochrome c553
MKKRLSFALAVLAGTAAWAQTPNPAPSYPDWAYAVPTPQNETTAPKDDGAVFTLPGSSGKFTRSQISGAGRKPPADWYPGDHPTMPKLIAAGDPARLITACAACHYPNGKGRPQNTGIAGLNAAYLVRQMQDMKNGLRVSSEPRKKNAHQMVAFAKAMTDAEMMETAAYYASLPPTVPLKVVETDTVPKLKSQDGMWLPVDGNAREPIGNRIVEMPQDVHREQLRDPRANFIAYVPAGAIAKGKAAARSCAMCHGQNLEGRDAVPGIAGRSPSYLARQLHDFQTGARRGPMAAMMKPPVAKMTATDIVNITAYLASLPMKP